MSDLGDWVGIGLAVLGFGANLAVQLRGGVWNAAKREADLKESMTIRIDASSRTNKDAVDRLRAETTQNLAAINVDIDLARKESQDQHDDTMAKFGDTVAALRQKVNDDALAGEKRFSGLQKQISDDALAAERMFMRRDDFNKWSEIHDQRIDKLENKFDERFNRVEALILNRGAKVAS